jgi:hypothetical protein
MIYAPRQAAELIKLKLEDRNIPYKNIEIYNENSKYKYKYLEVEFIALKRNFILQQKELKTLKEDNQNLSLDVINLSNENERLKQNFISKTKPDEKNKILLKLETEKQQELKRENKQQ